MPPNLLQRVAAVGRRAMRLSWLYGWAWFAIIGIALVAVACLADYFFRFQDHGLRWILSLATLGGLGWTAFRFLTPAWRQRRGPIAVAQRIERQFPQLGERLTSAVAFLQQSEDDALAGSAALRKAVVSEAESLSADLDFQQAIDPRGPKRLAGLAILAAALVGLLAAFDPQGAALAGARLAAPWSDARWPLRHSLAFRNAPTRLSAGDDFKLELIDRRGNLPDRVQLELRFTSSAGPRVEIKELQPLGDQIVFRLDNVQEGFAYRARGGDDNTMPWTQLDVVVPPKIVDLNVRIEPPAYSGRPAKTSGRVVHALVGSRLTITGRFDQRVAAAHVRSDVPGAAPLAIVQLSDGTFRYPPAGNLGSQPDWIVEKSGVYWFELFDAGGIISGRDMSIEVKAIPDSAPTIALELPADQTYVTPRALVPVQCLVKDDLAVQSVQLRFLRADSSDQEEHVVELFRGPGEFGLVADSNAVGEGDSQTIEESWDLSRIPGLSPGNVLAMRITADDYKPQSAASQVRRLMIISESELENRVVQRQRAILGQLAEVLRLQKEARAQVAALEIRLQETGKFESKDIDQLQSAELSQRQVGRLLTDPQDGIRLQVQSLLHELANNRVEGQAVARRMNDLVAQIDEVNEQHLPTISQRLIALLKDTRGETNASSDSATPAPCDVAGEVQQILGAVGTEQDTVIAKLESLLGELTQWDNFSRLAREVGQIRQDQARLRQETESLRLKAAVSMQVELLADDRATARQYGQRQLELARRFDKIQTRMEELLDRLRQSDPVAAGTLAAALEAGRELAIGGQMRDAARNLNEQRIGQAERTQQATLTSLAELLDLLANRRDRELAQTVKGLQATTTEMQGLVQRQAALQAEIDAAAAEPVESARKRQLQRLTKEAERLAAEAKELARTLERLEARRPAEAIGEAANSLTGAGEAASSGDAEQTQQRSREAERLLAEAQRQLHDELRQAQQDLLREQMARMEQLIGGIVVREQNLLAETLRLERLRGQQRAKLDRGQQVTLRGLAAEQRTLADEVGQLTAKLEGVEAFVFALEVAQRQMQRAANLLQRGETDNAPQEAEQAAITSLEQLLEALKPDEPSALTDSSPPSEQNPMPPPGNDTGLHSLAELKLLKLLQEELNRRTEQLETSAKTSKFNADQLLELDALSQEQGKLADMVLDLIKTAAPDDAERPPDGKMKKPIDSLDDALLRDLM